MSRESSGRQESPAWIYGIHTVHTLLKTAPDRVVRLLIQKQRNPRLQKVVELAGKLNIQIETVSAEEIEKYVSGNHQGACALCRAGEMKDEAWLYAQVEALIESGADHPPFLLILDGVTDPHNLGACLRTADATGVDAVIIPKDNSVGLTPVVQKVASGAADSVPLIAVTNLSLYGKVATAGGVDYRHQRPSRSDAVCGEVRGSSGARAGSRRQWLEAFDQGALRSTGVHPHAGSGE